MNSLIKIRYTLALIIALMFSALFCLTFPYEGTAIGKYFTKKSDLERVKEADVQAYSDQALFGDALEQVPEDIELQELSDSEQGFVVAERIRLVDKVVISVLSLTAWLMLIPWMMNRRWLSWIYLIVAFYIIAISVCKGINGGAMFSDLAVPAHATRWMACIAMWLWLFSIHPKKVRLSSATLKPVIYLLMLGIALTFAIHGYEAFSEHPKFKDLIYGSGAVFNIEFTESACIFLLKSIGAMDIGLAILVLVSMPRWRKLLLWMAFWGFVTAASRPIAFGDVAWCDALLRIGNGALPLLLYYIFKITSKQPDDEQT